jgi:hypothetical protein
VDHARRTFILEVMEGDGSTRDDVWRPQCPVSKYVRVLMAGVDMEQANRLSPLLGCLLGRHAEESYAILPALSMEQLREVLISGRIHRIAIFPEVDANDIPVGPVQDVGG